MLPILDFFYGIVPSYGLAIVALTLVIRFALYPLNAGSIRNMRRMKVTQPLMQKRVKEIQDRYKDDPTKLQEEMGKVYKEFGNPLAGCFPVLLQMPILFALFATLRGSPFSDIGYDVNFQVFPEDKIEQIQPQIFSTPPRPSMSPMVPISPSPRWCRVAIDWWWVKKPMFACKLPPVTPSKVWWRITPTLTLMSSPSGR